MIGNCPECHESIRVPDGDNDMEVRCPLCDATYSLGDVFKSLPPMLEVVGSTGVDFQVGPEGASPAGVNIDVNSGDGEPAVTEAKDVDQARTRYRPQRRREVNPMAEILKVILGGVVAIPIGILCVWWLGGRAPFGISQPVSKYVPWIVPEKLRAPIAGSAGKEAEDRGFHSGLFMPTDEDLKSLADKVQANREMFQEDAKKNSSSGGGLFGQTQSANKQTQPEVKNRLTPTESTTNRTTSDPPDSGQGKTDLKNGDENKVGSEPEKKAGSDPEKKASRDNSGLGNQIQPLTDPTPPGPGSGDPKNKVSQPKTGEPVK